MKLLDLEQQAQARAELGRAQLKVEVPAEVQQRIELEKALLADRGAPPLAGSRSAVLEKPRAPPPGAR